jgi:hypothetical protein
MNKIFFVMPLIAFCSFVAAMDHPSPRFPQKKVDSGQLRDGVRRKLSNPVARIQVDEKFNEVMTKKETQPSFSPRDTYQSIQDNKVREMNLRRRSEGFDTK